MRVEAGLSRYVKRVDEVMRGRVVLTLGLSIGGQCDPADRGHRKESDQGRPNQSGSHWALPGLAKDLRLAELQATAAALAALDVLDRSCDFDATQPPRVLRSSPASTGYRRSSGPATQRGVSATAISSRSTDRQGSFARPAHDRSLAA